MAHYMNVDFVSASEVVWEGQAVNVIVRTVDGDIGILPGHAAIIALLDQGAAEVVTEEGHRQILVIDGGFLSVSKDRVSIIAQHITLSEKTDVKQAQLEHDKMLALIDSGEATDQEIHKYRMLQAQLAAARRSAEVNKNSN